MGNPAIGRHQLGHDGLQLSCVPPELVSKIWPVVAHLIGRALERGGNITPLADVESDVFRRQAVLWVAHDDKEIAAAMVTQIHSDICTIVALSGHDRSRWIGWIGDIEHYAKSNGCSRMIINGRKGWMRVLPDYKHKCVVLERKL